MIFTDASTQGWGDHYPGLGQPHGGFPDFGYSDPFRPQAPHQYFGAQGYNSGPQSLGFSITGPPCSYDRFRQHHCCSLYQQTGWDLFPHHVTSGSGSVTMAANSKYRHPGQTYSGLSKCDSRPAISAELAHHNRVESPPRNSEPNIRDVGNSSSGHVCHSPQHTFSPVYVSSSRASSTGDRCSVTRLAGEVSVHVSTIFPAQPSHSEAQDHPGGRSDTNSPLVVITTVVSTSTTCRCLCVDHPRFFLYGRDLLCTTGIYVSSGKSYLLHA